ncbi:hypothetical protein WJ978_17130 [Achromobacter xylosoxidans]
MRISQICIHPSASTATLLRKCLGSAADTSSGTNVLLMFSFQLAQSRNCWGALRTRG